MSYTERARELRPLIEKGANSLPAEDAYNALELYPKWSANSVQYVKDQRVVYKNVLYVVLQGHVSQTTWTPAKASSLFAKVLIPDPDVIPEWEQPDSTNPYKKGDKVTHNGKTWESMIDGNVWEPGAPGTGTLWTEV